MTPNELYDMYGLIPDRSVSVTLDEQQINRTYIYEDYFKEYFR